MALTYDEQQAKDTAEYESHRAMMIETNRQLEMSGSNPAFSPSANAEDSGMSLRDYYIGQALAGIDISGGLDFGTVAVFAVDAADAVLKVRAEKDGGKARAGE